MGIRVYVNIPIGIAVILLSMRYLTFLKSQPRTNPKFDIAGYLYFALFIVGIQYFISLISKNAGMSWKLLGGGILIAGSLYLFIRSAKKEQPLLDLDIFKNGTFVNAAIIVMIRSLALYGGMFFLPFLLQGLLGYTPFQSGLLLLPNALMMLVSRPYAGKKADEGLIRNISVAGIILVSLSMALFSRIDIDTSIA